MPGLDRIVGYSDIEAIGHRLAAFTQSLQLTSPAAAKLPAPLAPVFGATGNLQVVTAHKLNMNAVLMAASNSAGGVMGKMISLQSIAVAAAATAMKSEDEAKLARFTLRHSVLLASVIGLITVFYAYVAPGLAP